jgi:hypothetical protein
LAARWKELGAGPLRGLLASQDRQQSLLQLLGNFDFWQLGSRAHGAAVRIDERHAGATALDVPLEELACRFGKASVEIITEELGDLPTLDR